MASNAPENLAPGDYVQVKDGEFRNFQGEVVSVTGDKAIVRFVIFGAERGQFPIDVASLSKVPPPESQ